MTVRIFSNLRWFSKNGTFRVKIGTVPGKPG
jgi:hypothetical protein